MKNYGKITPNFQPNVEIGSKIYLNNFQIKKLTMDLKAITDFFHKVDLTCFFMIAQEC